MGCKSAWRTLGLAVTSCALLAGAGAASAAVTIETVPVGDAGNVADATGYGRVNYDYNIGKYEVTAGQYTAFLNAVARTDTYALYNADMVHTDYGCGITRTGSPGSYAYTVDPVFENRPVNFVSYWDSCRFANWLNNGQPSGGQVAGITETGAYALNGYNGNSGKTIGRNAGAQWAVASENEWYKAAYCKGGSGDAGYWAYPTRSDVGPAGDMADVSGNNANYYYYSATGDLVPIDGVRNTTVVGEFQNSPGPYGTYDQCGNVDEWNETVLLFSWRCQRGGSYRTMINDDVRSSIYGYASPSDESEAVGFRMVQVPEPASLSLLVFAAGGMLVRRRRA